MYYILEALLKKREISKQELAERMGISLSSLSSRLNGRYKLSLNEAFEIKKILETDLSTEQLFATDPESKAS